MGRITFTGKSLHSGKIEAKKTPSGQPPGFSLLETSVALGLMAIGLAGIASIIHLQSLGQKGMDYQLGYYMLLSQANSALSVSNNGSGTNGCNTNFASTSGNHYVYNGSSNVSVKVLYMPGPSPSPIISMPPLGLPYIYTTAPAVQVTGMQIDSAPLATGTASTYLTNLEISTQSNTTVVGSMLGFNSKTITIPIAVTTTGGVISSCTTTTDSATPPPYPIKPCSGALVLNGTGKASNPTTGCATPTSIPTQAFMDIQHQYPVAGPYPLAFDLRCPPGTDVSGVYAGWNSFWVENFSLHCGNSNGTGYVTVIGPWGIPSTNTNFSSCPSGYANKIITNWRLDFVGWGDYYLDRIQFVCSNGSALTPIGPGGGTVNLTFSCPSASQYVHTISGSSGYAAGSPAAPAILNLTIECDQLP